jgi:hypothetical protein
MLQAVTVAHPVAAVSLVPCGAVSQGCLVAQQGGGNGLASTAPPIHMLILVVVVTRSYIGWVTARSNIESHLGALIILFFACVWPC